LELISIDMVNANGRADLHCCNREADFSLANGWVRQNVLQKLPDPDDPTWMTCREIRDAVLRFIGPSERVHTELWGYYAAYDHVMLCWLFGTMAKLPEGMPMHTKDIKQLSDLLGVRQFPKLDEHVAHNALMDAAWTRRVSYDILQPRAQALGLQV